MLQNGIEDLSDFRFRPQPGVKFAEPGCRNLESLVWMCEVMPQLFQQVRLAVVGHEVLPIRKALIKA